MQLCLTELYHGIEAAVPRDSFYLFIIFWIIHICFHRNPKEFILKGKTKYCLWTTALIFPQSGSRTYITFTRNSLSTTAPLNLIRVRETVRKRDAGRQRGSGLGGEHPNQSCHATCTPVTSPLRPGGCRGSGHPSHSLYRLHWSAFAPLMSPLLNAYFFPQQRVNFSGRRFWRTCRRRELNWRPGEREEGDGCVCPGDQHYEAF